MHRGRTVPSITADGPQVPQGCNWTFVIQCSDQRPKSAFLPSEVAGLAKIEAAGLAKRLRCLVFVHLNTRGTQLLVTQKQKETVLPDMTPLWSFVAILGGHFLLFHLQLDFQRLQVYYFFFFLKGGDEPCRCGAQCRAESRGEMLSALLGKG